MKYVKTNFFAARPDERDAEVLGRELPRWTFEVAGQRIHGTTRERPMTLFEQVERTTLAPLPNRRAEFVVWHRAKVHRDSHVVFGGAMYSVPWTLVGKMVWVRASGQTLELWTDDDRVAEHTATKAGVRSTHDGFLPQHCADYRHRTRAYWEQRADGLGPEVGAYIREVFESDDVLDQLRVVQAMVSHLRWAKSTRLGEQDHGMPGRRS